MPHFPRSYLELHICLHQPRLLCDRMDDAVFLRRELYLVVQLLMYPAVVVSSLLYTLSHGHSTFRPILLWSCP
jgi:hypothetical protein